MPRRTRQLVKENMPAGSRRRRSADVPAHLPVARAERVLLPRRAFFFCRRLRATCPAAEAEEEGAAAAGGAAATWLEPSVCFGDLKTYKRGAQRCRLLGSTCLPSAAKRERE